MTYIIRLAHTLVDLSQDKSLSKVNDKTEVKYVFKELSRCERSIKLIAKSTKEKWLFAKINRLKFFDCVGGGGQDLAIWFLVLYFHAGMSKSLWDWNWDWDRLFWLMGLGRALDML